MDVSKVTLDRKILISIICLIAAMEVIIFLHFHSWREQIPLSLLALLLLFPACAACKNIKLLLNKDKNWTEYNAKLEKQLKKSEEETKEFKKLINGIDAFVFSYEAAERKWFLSERFIEFSEEGFLDHQRGIRIIEDKIHHEDKKHFLKKKVEWLAGTPTTLEFRIILQDDQVRWIELRTRPVIHSEGKVERIFGTIIDVTDRKEKEEKLEQMAFYDTLTDLPNRTMLKSHLRKVLSRAKRKEHEVTIMFIDLDGFKDVNDSLGHDIGDALLKEVAARLNDSVREEDLISRLGGDEFIIVFEETAKKEVSQIADRIVQDIGSPYDLSGNKVSVTPSIGISNYPDDGLDIEILIRNADKAMYLAKNNGKNNYRFYTPDLEDYHPKESLIDKFLKFFQK